jgi:hypothetical protein
VVARAVGEGAAPAQASIRLTPAGQALVLSARDVGAWGNRLQVELSAATRKGVRIRVRELEVSAGAPRLSALEDFDNVAIDGGPPVLLLVDYINRCSQWISASVSPEPLTSKDAPPPASGTWQLQGGADGSVTAESFLSGLAALKMSWHCGLVCMPDLSQSWWKAEDRERVTAAVLAHCSDELTVAVLAAATSTDELMRVHAPCDSAVAIAAWPWLSVSTSDGKQGVVVPPDGHFAGAIARSDRRRGVHKQPVPCALAGTLQTIPSIAGSDERRAEYALEADRRGFNLLATADGKPQVFSSPLITTALAEIDKDATSARLRMFIVRQVRLGLMWVTFERQGEEVERRMRQQVEEFLHKLWKLGALGGASPEEAYRVTVEADPSGSVYLLGMQMTAPSNSITHVTLPIFH